MNNKLLYIILFSFICLLPINVLGNENLKEEYQLDIYKAKVIDIKDEVKIEDSIIQTVEIEILNKDNKGDKAVITKTYVDNNYDRLLKKGNKITVHKEDDEDTVKYYFNNIDKTFSLGLLVSLFVIFVIILGGLKGFKALVALGITIAIILFFLTPLLLKGYNPIVLSIITAIMSSILTFIITNGFSKKTLSAIIGVSLGLLIGGLFAYLFGIITKITGFSSENAQMLQYLPGNIKFDFKGLLFAGIIIGSLGACMDTSISIASSLTEIKSHNKNISDKELIKSGFNIGKDIMGTMVNTLVLAYTGTSLATILIFTGFNKGFTEIINLDSIATEIIRAVSGSIGLLFAIPFTIFAFILLTKKGEKNEKE